jgi:SAM-dependent methyltransferase
MDDRIETNRLRWDEMATLHLTTYGTDAAKTPGSDLLWPFEIDELGDIDGQLICHLQCHIGGDAVALARLGATVMGVDFSPASIEIARQLAERSGLAEYLTFVCATVDEAPQAVGKKFDGVYTSWGVLCWLPDIDSWAQVIARLLKDDGWLYLAETHPYATAMRWPDSAYGGASATFDESQGDYTSDTAVFEHPQSWEWSHGLGEVITALVRAGMQIEWLNEHAEVPWHLNDKAHLHRRPDGMWEEPGSTLPLSFSLRATKTGKAARSS